MQLTRATVTVASRIMLPTYVALFIIVGVNYLATDTSRLVGSPTLAYADAVIPLHAWGVVFLSVAVLMTLALVSANRMLYRYGLWLGILHMLVWSLVLGFAAWGVVFLVVAGVTAAAAVLALRRPRAARWVALACAMLWVVLLLLVPTSEGASPSAWAWPAFVAAACYASNRSLVQGER